MNKSRTNSSASDNQVLKVALAGNPNTGKTSLFNRLTGARQHVGNYPGVTVEKKEGACLRKGITFEITDLPGTYSLSSYSPEEKVAQDEILTDKFDVVVVTADATNLSRSLVILAQTMMTGARCVLCLNMWDEAEAAGKRLNISLMSALLGFPVVTTVGHRGIGIDNLFEAICEVLSKEEYSSKLVLGERIERAVSSVRLFWDETPDAPKDNGWRALQLIVEDNGAQEEAARLKNAKEASAEAHRQREIIESETGLDIQTAVTEAFFGFVDGLLREVTEQEIRSDIRAVSDRIDSIAVHRVWGLPIFALAMYAVFYVTFTLGEAPMGWIEDGIKLLGNQLTALWPPDTQSPLKSLLVNGVIGGVGNVVVFLPNILLLFLGLAFLEDTGYMARAAFLMDRIMHRFGLHGKSFLPLISGFGCTVPGIMAARTLENHRDRLVTMFVLPLMSCGARLPIWLLLVPAFFTPVWRAPMLFIIYFIGVFAALLLALLLRKTVLKSDDAPFVMELPPYRLPTLKAVGVKMMERSWLYLKKAGTVILAISVLMWFAASYPKLDDAEVEAVRARSAAQSMDEKEIENAIASESLKQSFAGKIGQFLEPAFKPLGFDWKIACAMIGAFAAKELFVSQMGVVYSMGETDTGDENAIAALGKVLARDHSPLVGLSLILFLLIGAPCMATLAVMRRETGSFKWALFQFFGLTGLAWAVSFAVYQIGRIIQGG